MLKRTISVLSLAAALSKCGAQVQEAKDPVPAKILAVEISESDMLNEIIPNLSPPQRLNIDMEQDPMQTGLTMIERCESWGGQLIEQICFNIDY